ncbi:unnamed protein product [Thlaspi arvense]|uniref:Uncharacterized protein n=1 Tax=Thlaspi arvense TaxID=13288 RepID=A0AAU9TCA8_THLAR|nr:unnamed protein product [Thlaspi arvense]
MVAKKKEIEIGKGNCLLGRRIRTIDDSHWVGIVLDLTAWSLYVMDCSIACVSNTKLVPNAHFPLKRMDLDSGVTAIALLEMHATSQPSDCSKIMETTLRIAAANYAMEVFTCFNPSLLSN